MGVEFGGHGFFKKSFPASVSSLLPWAFIPNRIRLQLDFVLLSGRLIFGFIEDVAGYIEKNRKASFIEDVAGYIEKNRKARCRQQCG